MAAQHLFSPKASQARSGNNTSYYNDLLANDITFDQQQIDQIFNNQYFQDENDQEWWNQVDTSGLQYDATLFPTEPNHVYHDQSAAQVVGYPQHQGLNTFDAHFTSSDFYPAGSAPTYPTQSYVYTQQQFPFTQDLTINSNASYADSGAVASIPPSLQYPPVDLTQFDFQPIDASAAAYLPMDYTQSGEQVVCPLQVDSAHINAPLFFTSPLKYAGTPPTMRSQPGISPSPAVPLRYQPRNFTQAGEQGELEPPWPQAATPDDPEDARSVSQLGTRHDSAKDDYFAEPFPELSAKEILLGGNEDVKVLSHEIDGPAVLKVAMEHTNQEVHGYINRLQRQERVRQQTLNSTTKRISNSLKKWAAKAGCDAEAAVDKFIADWRDERMKQLAARRKTGNALNPRYRPKMRASAKARQARNKSSSGIASTWHYTQVEHQPRAALSSSTDAKTVFQDITRHLQARENSDSYGRKWACSNTVPGQPFD